MQSIKNVWLSNSGDALYMICLRQYPEDMTLFYNAAEMPPNEVIGDKRIGIDEAKEKGLIEMHHRFGLFGVEDLLKLRNAIDDALRLEGLEP